MYQIETKCIQSGYHPENGQPRTLPIYQSTTYKFDDGNAVGKLFDLEAEGHMYSRISTLPWKRWRRRSRIWKTALAAC